jgi:hypothetical protein
MAGRSRTWWHDTVAAPTPPTAYTAAGDPLNSDRAVPTGKQLDMPPTDLHKITIYGWSTSG